VKRVGWILAIVTSTAGCAGSDAVGSLGARLGRDNDTHALYVRDVPEGFAANAAGIEPGDEIVMIDGFYVRNLTSEELHAKLRGPVGSDVALTLARGDRVLHVELRRSALRDGPAPKPKEDRLDECRARRVRRRARGERPDLWHRS
jgi:carboxyl-terminal processing protease